MEIPFDHRARDTKLALDQARIHIADLEERNSLLEAEVIMLRRRRGTGLGRGRPPEWTGPQADAVRSLHAAGASLGDISHEVGLTRSQVRTILKPKAVSAPMDYECRMREYASRVKDFADAIRAARFLLRCEMASTPENEVEKQQWHRELLDLANQSPFEMLRELLLLKGSGRKG